jgi:FkbM family methyltransferase
LKRGAGLTPAAINSLDIPRRAIRLWQRMQEIDRPKERVAFVGACILGAVTGRRDDLFPDLVINLHRNRFFCRKRTSDWLHAVFDFEPETTNFLLGQHGSVFLDVGAHIGRYSVLLAGNFRQVISVEPSPETFGILSRNVRSNGIGNITLINEAVAEKEGLAELYYHGDFGLCSIEVKSGKQKQVHATTVDQVLGGLAVSPEEISLVKLDIEGAEQRALMGAHDLLERGNARLVLEARSKIELENISYYLNGFGYCLRRRLDHANYLFGKHD